MNEIASLQELWLDYALEQLSSTKPDAETLERLRHAWVAGADAVIRALLENDPPHALPKHGPAARNAMLERWDAEMTAMEAARFKAWTERKEAGAGQHSAGP
jgi:hypothetical protein